MSTKIKYGSSELEKEFGAMTFGALLRNLRETEEVSQKDYAKKIGISPQRLNDFEKGRRLPDIKTAIGFAKKLKDSEHFFLQILFQDYLRAENLKYNVSVTKKGA